MKALTLFYFIVWLYAIYYAGYMIYELLGDKSIPLFISLGILFILKWVIGYVKLKGE